MTAKTKFWPSAVFFSVLVIAAAHVHANVSITAEVNQTSVFLNDQIVLSVSVSGPHANLPDPQIPPMPNFSAYSSGRSQNISFVNGSLSSSIVHTYVLVPRFVGKGTIEPISLTYSGQTVKTAPIEIQVRPPTAAGATPGAPTGAPAASRQRGSAREASGPEVFITAELDKKKAFVDEQVILTVRFYTAASLLGNPQYTAPKLNGFIAEDLPPERHGTTSIRGKTYYYSEIKTALFAASAGKLAIGPATVRCQVQEDVAVDPFASDFFQRFFSQGIVTGRARDLSSEPLTLVAEPLPDTGKPSNFSGAVGRYSISASVDKTAAKVGEAVNLVVTISGTGNLQSVGEPKLPDLPGFRGYETISSLNLDKKDDLVRGSKVFRTVLVPRVSGPQTIAPIHLSYFNPEKRAYMDAATLPITLHVAPGAAESAPAADFSGLRENTAKGLTAVAQDIRYLKNSPKVPASTRALEAVSSAGPWHTLPFLLFALTLSLTQYREMQRSDKKGTRFRGAAKASYSKIKEASGLRDKDAKKAALLLSEALGGFLAGKLGESASGLTLRRVQDLLRAHQPHLGAHRLEEIRDLWEELDGLRFAPGSGSGAKTLPDRLAKLIRELDKEITR